MIFLWAIASTFWTLGLLLVFPFVFIFGIGSKEWTVLLFGVLYGALGYLFMKIGPDYFKRQLLARAAPFKAQGFAPGWEFYAKYFDRYLGFDKKSSQLLYVENKTLAQLIGFDQIRTWSVECDRRNGTQKNGVLKLTTRIPALPTIILPIKREHIDEYQANLGMIFED